MTQTIDERLDAEMAARDPADMGKVQDEIEKGRAAAISAPRVAVRDRNRLSRTQRSCSAAMQSIDARNQTGHSELQWLQWKPTSVAVPGIGRWLRLKIASANSTGSTAGRLQLGQQVFRDKSCARETTSCCHWFSNRRRCDVNERRTGPSSSVSGSLACGK